jgi:hypothetical protein
LSGTIPSILTASESAKHYPEHRADKVSEHTDLWTCSRSRFPSPFTKIPDCNLFVRSADAPKRLICVRLYKNRSGITQRDAVHASILFVPAHRWRRGICSRGVAHSVGGGCECRLCESLPLISSSSSGDGCLEGNSYETAFSVRKKPFVFMVNEGPRVRAIFSSPRVSPLWYARAI